jgi:C4-type Zn-finger protein
MTDQTEKRSSHCSVCGKRLSTKTPTGDVQWHHSLVDEKGIFCDTCYKAKGKTSAKKKPPRTK